MIPGMQPGRPRVLIVKLSALGDLFHALPVAEAIRQGLNARMDWVTQSEYAELVRCFSGVDRVIAYPRHGLPAGAQAFWTDLRRTAYDLVIDLQGLLKSALVSAAARTRRRIGPSHHREGAGWLYHASPPRNPTPRHAVDVGLDVVRLLGLPPPARLEFPVRFPPARLEGPPPRIGLIPCSRWPTKNWPPDRFAEVAERLRARHGGSYYVIGGPADRDVCAAVARSAPGAADLSGRTPLAELGGVLAGLDLVITVDTGPMHMAAAAGAPVLAVFGATDPARTGPVGSGHRVLHHPSLPCRPCRQRTCRRRDLACLYELPAAEVASAATEMLEARAARKHARRSR